MPKTSTVLTIVAVAIAAVFTFTFIKSANDNIEIAKETNVYNRTTSCILSVPLATRTYEYISECYNKAERYNGVKVERFGTEKEYENGDL